MTGTCCGLTLRAPRRAKRALGGDLADFLGGLETLRLRATEYQ